MPKESFADIAQQTRTFPLPPNGFNPTSANAEELERYGLCARSDELAEVMRSDLWQRMVGKDTKFIVPEFPLQARGGRATQLGRAAGHQRSGVCVLRRKFRHRESSRNWSGLYVTPPRPNRFIHVSGRWKVPDVKVPQVLPHGASRENEEYQSSVWIGIDGRRSFPNSSLPQIGTGQHVEVKGGQAQVKTAAWYQWWVKDRPEHHVPQIIPNFPVAVGDEILASLTVLASGDVFFQLKNERSKLYTAFIEPAPRGIVPLGSTAEWIVERPTEFGSTHMYPLPHYDDVVFSDCTATSMPAAGAPAVMQRLQNARLIRMYEIFDNPGRMAFVSLPEKIDDTSARVVYREPRRQSAFR